MKVVQLFDTYLNQTENWCYRMLKNLPDTKLIIISERQANLEAFRIPDAGYVIMHPELAYRPELPWLVRKVRGALRRTMSGYYRARAARMTAGAGVLHAHFSVMGWRYLWLAKRTGIPLVVSFYGYDYERLPRMYPQWRGYYKILFQEAALFLAEGEAGRDKLISMGCPSEKTEVARLGVNVAEIPLYRRKKEPGRLSLVQVATFVEKKGHATTVKAFIKAQARCPDMTLTLVGKDPEGIRGCIEAMIKDAHLEVRIRLIDGIDFTRLHEFLKGFDVFVHPSRYAENGDCEGGAPIVLLDAQATGMPVISTTHCDIPSEVVHGSTGLLSGEDDVDSLAEAMEKFCLMGNDEYQGYSTRARRHVEDNFDDARCAARLREIYGRLAGSWEKSQG